MRPRKRESGGTAPPAGLARGRGQGGAYSRARRRASAWLAGPEARPYASAWSELLELPIDELEQQLTDRSDRMCALRQASPFAGAIDAATRWKILKRPDLRCREAG